MGWDVEPCLGVAVHRLAVLSRLFGPLVYINIHINIYNFWYHIRLALGAGLVALFGPLVPRDVQPSFSSFFSVFWSSALSSLPVSGVSFPGL